MSTLSTAFLVTALANKQEFADLQENVAVRQALQLIWRKALNSEMCCPGFDYQSREESWWSFIHVPGSAGGPCGGADPHACLGLPWPLC